MRIGIDISLTAVDNRGMGRCIRNWLPRLVNGDNPHGYVLFYRKKFSLGDILHSLKPLRLDEHRYEIRRADTCDSASVDVHWSPWNRIDFVPRGSKGVMTMHDMALFDYPPRLWFDRFTLRRRFRRYKSRADLILTDSHFSKTQIIKYMSVPEERVRVISLGVDTDALGGRAAAFPQCSALSPLEGSPFVLFVSANDFGKNLARLSEAFAIYAQRNQDALKLVLCGAGIDLSQISSRTTREPGLLATMIVPGHVSDADLGWLYQNATIFVFPSFYEGFGLPVLEAMAFGCPVVCSIAASIPEVAGEAALYFDPFDPSDIASKIETAVRDSELRRELSEKGLAQARRFSWDESAAEILNALETLAGNTRE